MPAISMSLLTLAAVLSIFFGIRYFTTREFMPYHAVVAGTPWAGLGTGMQTVILGMLRIVAGGLATYGVALLWLLLPISRHEAWAAWAALSITLTAVVPTLYVTVWLRRMAPGARTPVLPAAIVLAVAVFGAAGSLIE